MHLRSALLKTLLLAVVAALLLQSADARAQAPQQLKLGILGSDVANLLIYVGDAQGLFKAEGLDLKIVTFSSDAAAAQGLTAGAVDVNVGSIVAILNSYSAGHDLKPFWSVSNFPAYTWYGLPKYASMTDLKGGGKIGISSFSSLTHVLTQWAVSQVGLVPDKDVLYVAVGGPLERVAALRAGQVDAIPATPPGSYLLEQEGFKLLLDLKTVSPQFEYETFYGRQATLAKQADAITLLLRAEIRAGRWASQHSREAADILMKSAGAPADQQAVYVRAVEAALPYFPEDGDFPATAIQSFAQFYQQAGKLKAVPTLDELVDRRFVEYFRANPVQ
jgi:NitT/TauT family transport system substrate-binding protein